MKTLNKIYNFLKRFYNSILKTKARDITPTNIKNFIEGTTKHFIEDIGFYSLPTHEKQQMIYRSITCKDCTLNGSCLVCHCNTPEVYYSGKACSGGHYPALMNKSDWEVFKLTNNITDEMLEKTVVKTGELVKDLGVLPGEGTYLITYELENVGLNPMKIKSIATSCGCTASNYSKEEIGVGEKTTITLKFSGKNNDGKFMKTASVDGNFDPIKLKFKGEIIKPNDKDSTVLTETQNKEVQQEGA